MIESLPVGKYTLREKSALYGYKAASDVTFEVKETAEIQKVSITWKYAHIFFLDILIYTLQQLPFRHRQLPAILSKPMDCCHPLSLVRFVAVVLSVVAVAVAVTVTVAASELLFPLSVVASVVVPPVARLISKSALHSPSV